MSRKTAKKASVGEGTLNNADTQSVTTSHNPLQTHLSLQGFPAIASHFKSLREDTRGLTNSVSTQGGRMRSLGGYNISAACQLRTQDCPRDLTGEYKSIRAWQAVSDPAHSFANQNRLKLHRLMTFDVMAGGG